MNIPLQKTLLASVIAASTLPMTTPAVAQDGALLLEEILVTARKREENLQEVPISINAFSAAAIERLNITSTEDTAFYTPALTYDVGVLPNDTRPVIRGVVASRGRANVATLIDGIDITSESLTVGGGGMTASLRLMDLERIEVVKGPQSTLYGRSAFTGAVSYITKRPSEEFEGQVELNFDEHGTQEGRLSLSGPLTDTLGARLNLSSWETDGWYENPNTGDDLGDGEALGGALALEWRPSETFTAYGRVEYNDDEYGPRAQVLKRTMRPGTVDENIANGNFFLTGLVQDDAAFVPYDSSASQADCDASRGLPFYDSSILGGFGAKCRPISTGKLKAKERDIDISPDPAGGGDYDGMDGDNLRVNFDFTWQLEDVTVKLLAAHNKNETHITEDFDLTNYSILTDFDPVNSDIRHSIIFGHCDFVPDDPSCQFAPPTVPYSQIGLTGGTDITHELEQTSLELQVSGSTEKFEWFVGGLWWEEDMDTTWDDLWWLRDGANEFIIQGIAFFPFVTEPQYGLPSSFLKRDTEHWSVSASLGWAITDTVTLTLEGRYLDDQADYAGSGQDRGAYSSLGILTPPASFIVGKGNGGKLCGFDFSIQDVDCFNTKNGVSETEFVPKVSLDWQVNDTVMLYATYAEGFKPGGIDTTDGNSDIRTGEYKPEELDYYELGAKANALQNRVLVNMSLFLYDYTDQQQSIQIDTGGFTSTAVVNAGETEVKGLDLDFSWQLTDNFVLSAGYVYSDSEYKDFVLADIAKEIAEGAAVSSANNLALAGNDAGDFTGNRPPLSAEHSATLSLFWQGQITDDLGAYADLTGAYQSKRYLDNGNNAYLPSYDVWNLTLGLEGNDSWSVIFYVDNLFDDDTIKSGLLNVDYGLLPDGAQLSLATNLVLPQPRTAGLRAIYRF